MKICFFVRLQDKTREERLATLHRVEFYAQDIKILQDLGHEVILATRFSEVPWNADFYFCWWWTFSFIPILKAKLSGKPLIITGTFDHILPKGLINYYDRPLLQRLWLRSSLWLADANVFVSECEYKSVTEMLGCRKPYYSPHIIYTDEYKPSADPKREEELIFTVSWLYEFNAKRKGIFEIIRAAALVKEAERPVAQHGLTACNRINPCHEVRGAPCKAGENRRCNCTGCPPLLCAGRHDHALPRHSVFCSVWPWHEEGSKWPWHDKDTDLPGDALTHEPRASSGARWRQGGLLRDRRAVPS